MILLVAVQGGVTFASAPAGDVARWIADLGSPQFARREAASKALRESGRGALAPLAEAIQNGEFEVKSRGIEIVGDMLASDDFELAAEAEQILERAAAKEGRGARLAATALEFHQIGTAPVARGQLEKLGAVFRERPLVDQAGIEVEFGASWKGTSEDLRQLARIHGLVRVGFHGVKLDAAAVAVIGRLRRLNHIELFGTDLDDQSIAGLAERLPEATIDVRKGGKLGVGAVENGGPCVIGTINPGSAADQAGIRAGDVIVAVDGKPVDDFAGLTNRLAGRGPGETVRVTIDRAGAANGDKERLEFDVRLDTW